MVFIFSSFEAGESRELFDCDVDFTASPLVNQAFDSVKIGVFIFPWWKQFFKGDSRCAAAEDFVAFQLGTVTESDTISLVALVNEDLGHRSVAAHLHAPFDRCFLENFRDSSHSSFDETPGPL